MMAADRVEGEAGEAGGTAFAGLSRTEWVLVGIALGLVIVAGISQSSAEHDHVTLGVLGAALWLPLVGVGLAPRSVLVVVVAIECVYVAAITLAGPVQFNSAPFAVMVAAYVVAVRRPWREGWLWGGSAAVVLVVVSSLERSTQDDVAANLFAFDLVLVATGLGVLVQSRRRRLAAMERRAVRAEQTREAEARRQVAEERIRMARELHDVVAHNLTLVNAQAGVAEYLMRRDPDAAELALRSITEHSRQALDELRATVGLLRQPGDAPGDGNDEVRPPTPGLADLPDLLAAHRRSDAEACVEVVGEPRDLPAMTDLTAYRIVQESLTNARKHAPGAATRVRLGWTSDHVRIRVENDAPARAAVQGPGTRHGLLGMRERALACGGSLEAGPRDAGGFAVEAVLPLVHPAHQEDRR